MVANIKKILHFIRIFRVFRKGYLQTGGLGRIHFIKQAIPGNILEIQYLVNG